MVIRIPYIGAYKVDYMLPFFLLGIAVSKNSWLITSGRMLGLWTLLFIIGMLLYKDDYIWYINKSNWWPFKQMLLQKQLMFDWHNFVCCLIRTMVGAVASLFFVSLFYHLGKSLRVARLFGKIGKWGMYTLHVYILQTFIVEMNILNIKLPSSNEMLFNFVYAPLSSFGVTVISIALAMVLEKNKYINKYLFGK